MLEGRLVVLRLRNDIACAPYQKPFRSCGLLSSIGHGQAIIVHPDRWDQP